MLEFLIANWVSVLIALAIVGLVIYLAVTRKWDELRALAYETMLGLEKLYKELNGAKKFDAVVKAVLAAIPIWFKIIAGITEEKIKEKIQEWYEYAMDFLDDGEINKSY